MKFQFKQNKPIAGLALVITGFLAVSCSEENSSTSTESNPPVASHLSDAKSADGLYISWKEHRVDDFKLSGVPLSGSDGLIMGDLDLDGYPDIVSVHESDTEYDGIPKGHIRIAFGTSNPDRWENITLAEGPEAGAAEDVDIADLNKDGFPDIIAACELEHLIYFQNPGKAIRSTQWPRIIPSITANRGSFIRVFFADFDGDGALEVSAPNKGRQSPGLRTSHSDPISWFKIDGDPMDDTSWSEHILTRVDIPENARPVDLDGDGDLDILGASRGEERIFWFENRSDESRITFKEHPIDIRHKGERFPVTGVNVDFVDFNEDGRLDIVVYESPYKKNFGWIEQPSDLSEPWPYFPIGTVYPDTFIGLVAVDINGDGKKDIMTGTYSSSPRDHDGPGKTVNDRLGRLAWFEPVANIYEPWIRHDISRRIRGMFDKFVPRDLDGDGDIDFVSTRGNSHPYDGVFWLEQVRTEKPVPRFQPARKDDSKEVGLPE